MNILRKLIPAPLQRLDKYLLLNHPALWALKLHILLWFQLICALVMLLVSYVLPMSLDNIPAAEIPGIVMFCIFGLIMIGWLFLAHLQDIRTRIVGKPLIWEIARILSYGWTYGVLLVLFYSSVNILNHRITQLFPGLDAKSSDEAHGFVSEFERQYAYYLEGLEVVEHKYDQDLGKSIPITIPISKSEVESAFARIAELNAAYGDRMVYSVERLMQLATDKNLFSYSYLHGQHAGALRMLDRNLYDCDRSYTQLKRHLDTDDYFAIVSAFALIFGILSTLILYFKYFEIRGVIQGILSPGVLFLLGIAIFGLLWEMTHNKPDELGIDFICALAAMIIAMITLSKGMYSHVTLFIYQSLPTVLVCMLVVFLFERVRDLIPGEHNWESEAARVVYERRDMLQLVSVSFFSLVIIPFYQYGLYRLFYLPKK